MTTLEKLESRLIACGMFPSQAKEVMQKAVPELNSLVEGYSITMNGRADEYPEVIYDILFLSVKPVALSWIEENCPQAWFKPMFV